MLINSIEDLSKISLTKQSLRTLYGEKILYTKRYCKLHGHPNADKNGNVEQKILLVEYLLKRNLKDKEKIQILGNNQLQNYNKIKHATTLKVNLGIPSNSLSSKPIVILFDKEGKRYYYFFAAGRGSPTYNSFGEIEIYDKNTGKTIDVYPDMPITELEKYINNPRYFIKNKSTFLYLPDEQ